MRNHLLRGGALLSAAALTFTLAACSGDDESTAAFCDTFASLEAHTGDMGSIMSGEPDAAVEKLESISAELDAVEPPAEIEESFGVFADAFRGMAEVMGDALTDPANADQEALTEATERMTNEEFGQATTELDAFTQENCS
jgi:hypothetical protein